MCLQIFLKRQTATIIVQIFPVYLSQRELRSLRQPWPAGRVKNVDLSSQGATELLLTEDFQLTSVNVEGLCKL